MIRLFAIFAALLILTGCRWGARECPTTPVVVEVPVPVREPIPASLLDPMDASMCVDEGPTVGDVRRQRAEACAEIETGNARLEAIKSTRAEDQ